MKDKEKAIECISELIYQTTFKQGPYDNRLKGFIAEALAPMDLVEAKGYKAFKGGWIIPMEKGKRFRETEEVLYISALSQEEYAEYKQHYLEIYNKLEKFKHKYIAVYEIDFSQSMHLSKHFTNLEFPCINIEFYKFEPEANIFVDYSYEKILDLSRKEPESYFRPNSHKINFHYKKILEKLNEESLYDILIDRYIFDYLFGNMFFERGIPADFDMIVNFPDLDNLYTIYEIKEKDPSKKNNNKFNVVGFGMDIERIEDYKVFSEWFPSLHFRYLVRQIDNQKDRNFVNWRSVGMKLFTEKAIQDPDGKSGGKGMLPNSIRYKYIPTAICPEEAFKVIQI